MIAESGTVYLVGAGPGDPGLITVRGRALLRRAEVVIHDRLIGAELLSEIGQDAQVIDVGKTPGEHRHTQHEINELLVSHARAGRAVVRLKGGDPFVFGRGWEEMNACRKAGVPCVVVPGITSAIAAPAAAGIPVTLRDKARSLAVVTARTETGDQVEMLNYSALSKMDTVVILMGRASLPKVARRLIAAGRSPDTPAACIEHGTTNHQRQVIATLGTVADRADQVGLEAPVVTCVGDVAACGLLRPQGEDSARRSRLLTGKRVVVTKARSSSRELRRLLSEAGAIVIDCPMIQIGKAAPTAASNKMLQVLDQYNWIVFTSVNGVRGFFRRLKARGKDARAVATCRIAAVGPVTARSLRRFGLLADVVPDKHNAAGLLRALANVDLGSSKVLLPRGDIAGHELPNGLRAAGAGVDELIVYRTLPATPSVSQIGALGQASDAILFCSPSAVRRFVALDMNANGAAVACIGQTSAEAAREAGLSVDVVAERSSSSGLVSALEGFFALTGVTA